MNTDDSQLPNDEAAGCRKNLVLLRIESLLELPLGGFESVIRLTGIQVIQPAGCYLLLI